MLNFSQKITKPVPILTMSSSFFVNALDRPLSYEKVNYCVLANKRFKFKNE